MGETEVVAKKAPWGLSFALTVLIGLTWIIVIHVLVRALGVRVSRDARAFLDGSTVVLARVAVDRILLRLGLSRRGKTVEVQARSPFGPHEEVEDGGVVEARLSRGSTAFIMIGGPIIGVGLLCLAGSQVSTEEIWFRWIVLIMGAYLTFASVVNLCEYGKPQARLDTDGVTGYPSHRAIWRRFVPWTDIFSCEIETFHDTHGKPALLRPILKGRHGEKLMALYLGFTPMIEQERVVKFIKTKLPETELDPWLM